MKPRKIGIKKFSLNFLRYKIFAKFFYGIILN